MSRNARRRPAKPAWVGVGPLRATSDSGSGRQDDPPGDGEEDRVRHEEQRDPDAVGPEPEEGRVAERGEVGELEREVERHREQRPDRDPDREVGVVNPDQVREREHGDPHHAEHRQRERHHAVVGERSRRRCAHGPDIQWRYVKYCDDREISHLVTTRRGGAASAADHAWTRSPRASASRGLPYLGDSETARIRSVDPSLRNQSIS